MAANGTSSSKSKNDEQVSQQEQSGSGGGGRRERKRKFDVKELLKIRGGNNATTTNKQTSSSNGTTKRASISSSDKSNNGNKMNNHKTRRSGRVKATAASSPSSSLATNVATNGNLDLVSESSSSTVTADDAVSMPTTEISELKSSKDSPVLGVGKRERKRKKFWDEQDSLTSSSAPKLSKKAALERRNSLSSSQQNRNSSSATPTPTTPAATTTVTTSKRDRKSESSSSSKVLNKSNNCAKAAKLVGPGQNGKTLHYLLIDLSKEPEIVAKQLKEGFNIPGPGEPIPIDSSTLPEGWEKRVVQRGIGITKGKWEVFIISPAGKSFRSKIELQRYFDDKKLPYKSDAFDFSLDESLKKLRQIWKTHVVIPRQKKAAADSTSVLNNAAVGDHFSKVKSDSKKTDQAVVGSNKGNKEPGLGVESETGQGVRCSQCSKLFRNDRLLKMHVKHYHKDMYVHINSSSKRAISNTELKPLSSSVDLALRQDAKSVAKVQQEDPVVESVLPRKKRKFSFGAIDLQQQSNNKKLANEENRIVGGTNNKKVGPPSSKHTSPESLTAEDLGDGAGGGAAGALGSEGIGILRSDLEDVFLKSSSASTTTTAAAATTPLTSTTSPSINNVNPPRYRMSKRRQAQLRKKNLSPVLKAGKAEESALDGKCYMEEYMNFLGVNRTAEAGGAEGAAADASAPPSYPPSEMGASVASEHLTVEEVVNCPCKRIEEDGLMIQCDICLCWQHGSCLGLEGEDQVPDKFICQICREPQAARSGQAFALDQDWLKEGKLTSLCLPSTAATTPTTSSSSNNGQVERELKKLCDLIADLSNLSKVLHSLRVKLQVASQPNNGKVFMWSTPWETAAINPEHQPPTSIPSQQQQQQQQQAGGDQIQVQISGNMEHFNHSHNNQLKLPTTTTNNSILFPPMGDDGGGGGLGLGSASAGDEATSLKNVNGCSINNDDENTSVSNNNTSSLEATKASDHLKENKEQHSTSNDENKVNNTDLSKTLSINSEEGSRLNNGLERDDADEVNVTAEDLNIDPSMIPSVSEVERLLPSIIQASLEDHLTSQNDSSGFVHHQHQQQQQQHHHNPVIIPEQKRIDKDECRQFLVDHIESLQREVNELLTKVEMNLDSMDEASADMKQQSVVNLNNVTTQQLCSSESLASKSKAIAIMLLQDIRIAKKLVSAV